MVGFTFIPQLLLGKNLYVNVIDVKITIKIDVGSHYILKSGTLFLANIKRDIILDLHFLSSLH